MVQPFPASVVWSPMWEDGLSLMFLVGRRLVSLSPVCEEKGHMLGGVTLTRFSQSSEIELLFFLSSLFGRSIYSKPWFFQ